ncbi:signal transducer and activator of transcription 6 isoform X4 [Nerophis lumbriciformis]|uniref:signal transducer and activator of transcription 6 isoform X4 n=1 Tax=Nerophis lumbriciformis TaxID=546530 RepID=UPI002ADFA05D|nr:signal transducer and activator of transcription 6-like isoform X4 [Nerophis lumbriciformis]
MAQWNRMSQLLHYLPDHIDDLYPAATFAIEVRHFLSDWIEEQRWEEFALENVEQEANARALLDEIILRLQSFSQQNANVVDKMKLMQISRNMHSMFQQQSLKFVVMVRDTLRKERVLLDTASQVNSLPQYPLYGTRESTFPKQQDVDHLVLKVVEVRDLRKKIHQLQEELNWERQNYESLQGRRQQNGLDPTASEINKLQKHIQQLEYNVTAMATKRFQLLNESVDCLDQCQAQLLSRLKTWRWEQYKATIGHPFADDLNILQMRCEQLLGVNGNLRQELMIIGDPIPELQERLRQLLQVLVQSDNVGEVINNTAILEHNTATKSTCATFRNMSIKKIKRADRKGSESVTEEKFALLFSTEITITGCDTPYKIQMISLPIVVIVHGSQENNAMATIIWDCAFSEPDRVPFVVPERVPWKVMCNTLNSKFTSEVQTNHNLHHYNQHFLAQKIFDKPDFNDDFSNMMVSWPQFNKEVLPGRLFTFWQWFEGVMELTKKHLRTYWSDGLIFGFIGKQHLHLILKARPNGTFLLRFSDSEIGGITIAYVSAAENGRQIIQNIQPFTKKDLEIRSLGDSIRDINDITFLYPDFPKHEVFKKYYSEPQTLTSAGYIPFSLRMEAGSEAPNGANMAQHTESHHNAAGYPLVAAASLTNMTHHAESSHKAVGYPLETGPVVPLVANMAPMADSPHNSVGFAMHQFQQFSPAESLATDQMETSESPAVEFSSNSPSVFNDDVATDDMGLVLDSLLSYSYGE